MAREKFSLKWNEFESALSCELRGLRAEFTDVALACEDGDQVVEAHKIILAACSPVFRGILRRQSVGNSNRPFLFLRGVKLLHLDYILTFMYTGEVDILDVKSFYYNKITVT